MKYFFVSDIHGCYSKLVKALAIADFDMEKDTLVSVGDPFDRGSQSKEVLDFILSCPNHIIIIGNHDWRLRELIKQPSLFTQYDITNGIPETVRSFLQIPDDQYVMMWNALPRLSSNEQLHRYFEEAVLYIEFKDLIAVHGWIPYHDLAGNRAEKYCDPLTHETDWRKASMYWWDEAVWAHTEKCMFNHVYPEKRLLVGHWHAWRLAQRFGGEQREEKGVAYGHIDCRMWENEHVIAIDGCSNYPHGGTVNVYVYETDEIPSSRPFLEKK